MREFNDSIKNEWFRSPAIIQCAISAQLRRDGRGLLSLFNVCAVDVIFGPFIQYWFDQAQAFSHFTTNVSLEFHSQSSPTNFNPLPSSNQNATTYVNMVQPPGVTKRWRSKMVSEHQVSTIILEQAIIPNSQKRGSSGPNRARQGSICAGLIRSSILPVAVTSFRRV